MIERNSGTLTLTVNQTVEQLARAYVALIRSGSSLKEFPSVMLWGAPGVGKSQGVRQIAEEIERGTGKRVAITDVRLLLFNPVDLRGIPTANADKTLAVWLRPRIFEMDSGDDVINILFLDEISAAPQSVQASAYQITLDRTVGEHRLPDNCIVIAAGNRVTDRSVAYTMPKALANRLCHIEVEGDEKSWHDWAVSAGIHGAVIGFLDRNPEFLMRFEPASDALAFPTPRSWEMVSHILNRVSDNLSEVFPLIVGCVGETAAYELRVFCEIYQRIPPVEDIFRGVTVGIPARPEILLALSPRIVAHARAHYAEDGIRNMVDYVARMPAEFRNRIFTDLLRITPILPLLSRIRAYDDWFARSGRDWEDYGV